MPDQPDVSPPREGDTSSDTPFEGIEGAHHYVTLLGEAVDDAMGSIEEDLTATSRLKGTERRVEALRLAALKLQQLRAHITSSGRLLNDLRTLRRLLFNERGGDEE